MKDKIVIGALMLLVGIAIGQALGILPALAANPDPMISTFDLVPFRGRIEKDGLPHSDPVKLTFKLYATENAADPFYQEIINPVQPADGNFAVVLGVDGRSYPGNTTLKLSTALRANDLAYVGITVGSDPELTGRQRLAATPYSTRVTGVKSADIDPAQINATHIAAAQVKATHIAAGQVGSPQLADGGVLAQHIADGVVQPRHINPCRAGFVGVSDGRMCIEVANHTGTTGHNAIQICQALAPGTRVCTHADWQQACGSGAVTDRGGATSGWYGDIGNADDTMQTWNANNCSFNNTGGPAAATTGALQYRCCY